MKYIVIGLGRFGSKLASVLTEKGHEVIGIDHHAGRLDELKDVITTVMTLDSTNKNAISSLPLDDIDAVIVAIGEDIGASILTLTILKSLNVKRIIGRAISQIHFDILKQIGISEVVLPLEESARHVASMLQFENTLRLTAINDEYSIAEVRIPSEYSGHCLDTIDISGRFNLNLIAVKTPPKESILTTIFRRDYFVAMNYAIDQPLDSNTILVIAGKLTDIKRFVES